MSEIDYQSLLIEVFIRLRRSLRLGIGELLAALRLVDGGWEFRDHAELRQDLRLFWCRSPLDKSRFDDAWAEAWTQQMSSPGGAEEKSTPSSDLRPERADERYSLRQQEVEETPAQEPAPSLAMLPVQTPSPPVQFEEPAELNTYWPLSKRSMAYGWRYLRRSVADGPAAILDIPATVEFVARQGVFLAPVYRRAESNHAHLVLLVDQGGSMVPFHRFTRDLVESAQQSGHFAEGQVEAYYFHDLIGDDLYERPHLAKTIELERWLSHCDSDTSILIASDAGAARGYYRLERVRATAEFLFRLRKHTNLIAWLNPMPEARWAGTSAQVIAHLVPMLQMDADGFSRAIDVVRGIPLRIAS